MTRVTVFLNVIDNRSHLHLDSIHSHTGTFMYVCVCNAITDRDVRQAAKAGVASVAELGRELGVATNCGSCAELAQSILDTHASSRTSVRFQEQPTDMSGVYRYTPAAAI